MSNAKNIIKNLMEDNLVDTKKLIKQTLIQRIGVMLESKIEEVAPSMISERKTSDPAPQSKEKKEKSKVIKAYLVIFVNNFYIIHKMNLNNQSKLILKT